MRPVFIILMSAALVAAQHQPVNLSGVWTLRTDSAEQPAQNVTVIILHDRLRLKIIELKQDECHTVLLAHEYPLGRGKLELNPETASDIGTGRVRGNTIEIRFSRLIEKRTGLVRIEKWTVRADGGSEASLQREVLAPNGLVARTQLFKRAARVPE
jgi:hypothetical protein